MDFGFVATYLIRLIFGKTKDRKYNLQLYKKLHLTTYKARSYIYIIQIYFIYYYFRMRHVKIIESRA